ncbi:hypothetical protein NA57DRAFT_75953 [Rhizodiscina lignyota]|uniref:Uncharacterized protein n=1 Tax=Rhizodiscina lignyota TaxID=1504668 RepID=A0A9P4IG77_9PEZI|nr:hypothetical protein NA57DRAFT_75953 [Rhizodiscina lignyota]
MSVTTGAPIADPAREGGDGQITPTMASRVMSRLKRSADQMQTEPEGTDATPDPGRSSSYVTEYTSRKRVRDRPLRPMPDVTARFEDLPQDIRQYIFALAIDASTPRPHDRILDRKAYYTDERNAFLKKQWEAAKLTNGENTLRSLASVCSSWRHDMGWVCSFRVRQIEIWDRTSYLLLARHDPQNLWMDRTEYRWTKKLQMILAFEALRGRRRAV